MTREEYIDDIKTSLGAPVVDIELENQLIGKIVDRAFKEVSRYITETRYVTVPFSGDVIDVKGLKISSVVQIFRTDSPSRIGDLTDPIAIAALSQNSSLSGLSLSDYAYRTQLAQLKSTITTDLDFTFDKVEDKLYVNTFHPKPSRLTIGYIPEFKDVSEVTEQYWVNFILRLAIAFTKETVGRVRSKYELSSSLYKLDGDRLVSEGIAERDAVRQELDENSDIVFPID